MQQTDLPFVGYDPAARPIHAVRPGELDRFKSQLTAAQKTFLDDLGFGARPQELLFLPSESGLGACVLGLGEDRSPHAFGDLAYRLPPGNWRIEPGNFDASSAILGFCLGAYRYDVFKQPKRAPARIVVASNHAPALSQAAAAWMVRDLINAPANILGPAELAAETQTLAEQHGAVATLVSGEALDRDYPTVAAVGRGSARAPVVAKFVWQGSGAGPESALISLCGKGVCFDSGGYDLKPSAGMLRMKKDMGGAATVIGVARTIMDANLPIRLAVRIGCVENSVSGTAMRPLDVVRTRRGHSVEIGNTDAEGRLVLCDLLAEASDENPAMLLDCATLTGAARVALGPDLPALFANDDNWAAALIEAGTAVHDPVWRLPLWDGYDSWLDSTIADFNNVTTKPFAGSITAALFLRRFVAPGVPWIHLDLYAWNDTTRPGRPEGGEAQAVRAICYALEHKLLAISEDQNTPVT